MSKRTFKNRTEEIDQLLNDPEFAAAIKEHRKAFEQADREYATGLAATPSVSPKPNWPRNSAPSKPTSPRPRTDKTCCSRRWPTTSPPWEPTTSKSSSGAVTEKSKSPSTP